MSKEEYKLCYCRLTGIPLDIFDKWFEVVECTKSINGWEIIDRKGDK